MDWKEFFRWNKYKTLLLSYFVGGLIILIVITLLILPKYRSFPFTILFGGYFLIRWISEYFINIEIIYGLLNLFAFIFGIFYLYILINVIDLLVKSFKKPNI